ncbi:hypothetical protein [Myxacorys almedinensis]|uniref:Uncharacterized protein n=1 Tax=Myxacorys almedinensis A TaxID=2690445 RepID=A0A8J8CNJ1_9CYAN|nr:hypothetical protein [Myxacorys almedinensis]NDJ19625.1 hypothetical protein [Myxacorys almedinensis A]
MARYTCLFTLGASLENLIPLINETLQSCNLNVIYFNADYIMAKEIPGKVPFPKLVTVEVLVDRTTATGEEVKVNLVSKNEELPLQTDNHCYQVFDVITKAISEDKNWRLIETVR